MPHIGPPEGGPSQTGGDLIARAKAGSPDALDQLYDRSAARLLSFIRLRLGPDLRARLESRDILQAAMLRSLERIRQFEGSETRSWMAWLARIAENEIRDRAEFQHRLRRDAARELPLEKDAPIRAVTRSALTRVIQDEEARRLEAAMESLSDAHREIILLRTFQELTFGEIARRLGKTEDGCRMLMARAMTALTMKLAELPR
jgi:RNA polymerase sigma-70 factor (ECF subfamily)